MCGYSHTTPICICVYALVCMPVCALANQPACHRDTCHPCVTSVTIVQMRNQPRFPSIDKHILKWVQIYNGVYSAMKNEVMTFSGKLIEQDHDVK